MTDEDFAEVIGLRSDRRAQFRADIARLLEVGLLARGQDGRLIVPKHTDLQDQ